MPTGLVDPSSVFGWPVKSLPGSLYWGRKDKKRMEYVPPLIRSFLPASGCSERAIASVLASGVAKSTYANLNEDFE